MAITDEDQFIQWLITIINDLRHIFYNTTLFQRKGHTHFFLLSIMIEDGEGTIYFNVDMTIENVFILLLYIYMFYQTTLYSIY